MVDDGIAAALVDDDPAWALLPDTSQRFFECSGVFFSFEQRPHFFAGADTADDASSLPEAMTMSTSAAVAMDAACILVYMPPVPMLDPASPAIS